MLTVIEDYKNRNMDDEDWAVEVENLVQAGTSIDMALKHVMKLRDEYKNYIAGLGPTKQDKDISYRELFNLHRLEVEELHRAYLKNDDKNVEEEIFDVIQTLLNIIDYKNINIEDALLRHKLKLESRGRVFKEDVIKFLY